MGNLLTVVFKKGYNLLLVLAFLIMFFLGYNLCMVDYSPVNLRLVLNKVNYIKTPEEAKKLASVLDYSLFNEVASRTLQDLNIAKIELAKDILSKSRDVNRLKDVKFCLQEVIKQKEGERKPAILITLDMVSSIITPGANKVSKAKLAGQARRLRKRISNLGERDKLQNAYYLLANTYTLLSEFEKAKEAYQKAIALNPDSYLAAKSRFNLAWNEKNWGDPEKAIKEFEETRHARHGTSSLEAFSKYQIGEAYKKKGDYEKAVSIYEESEAKHKRLAQIASLQAGITLLYDLKQPEKAREVFEKAKTRFRGTDLASHIEGMLARGIVK
jgi:tetratricopeptide (TPR) repeat protein